MTEGFDKEIDFLLRQTAQSETVFSKTNLPSNHLDADEISAFAENALPEKTRQNYILHLADCGRCRKSLSNLIELNAATQSEIIHAEESELLTTIAPAIPWYRKFFAVPTLAYAMGALVLLFAGIGVFTILQKDSMNSQLSQVSEKQIGGKGMASDGDAATQEVYSNRTSSNMAAMNSATSTNITANSSNPTLSPKPMTANSNLMLAQPQPDRDFEEARKENKSLSEQNKPREIIEPSIIAPPPPPSRSDDAVIVDGQAGSQQPNSAQNQTTQNQTQIMPDTRNAQRAPVPSAKMQKQENESDELKKSPKDKSDEKSTVGGKTFKRANNIWVDSAYRGQATTNISRGTKEYKKLDSGLRGIVENLGGTVIVVWKEKAYRIQ